LLDNAGGEPAGTSQPRSAEDALVDPGLVELAWAWDASLALIPQRHFSRARWRLEQAGRPVVAIEQTTAGWSLYTAVERWVAAVRRRPRRLGWHLEFSPADAGRPVLFYYPRTVLAGGKLVLAQGDRYKLSRRLPLGSEWELAAVRGGDLARLTLWTSRPRAARVYGAHAGLRPRAAREPNLQLLLAAGCVALAIDHQQPRFPGPPP
jgi:hypothetical protein